MLDLAGIIYFIRRICKGWHKKLLGRKSSKGRQKRKARSKRSMKALNTKGCRLYLSVLIVILIEYYKYNSWSEIPLRKSINQLAPYRVNYYKRRYYDGIFSDLTAGHELVFSLFKALKLSFISNSYRDIVRPLVTLTTSITAEVIILEQTREETRTESERANTEQEMEVMSTLTEQKPSDESQTSAKEQPEISSGELSLIDDTVTNKEQPKTESTVDSDEAQAIADEQTELTPPEDVATDEEQAKAKAPSDEAEAIIGEQSETTIAEDITEDVEQLKAEVKAIAEKLEAIEKEIIAATNEQPIVLDKNDSTHITSVIQNYTSTSSSSQMPGSSDNSSPKGTNDLFEEPSYILDPRIREDDEVVGDDVVKATEQVNIKPEAGINDVQNTHDENKRRLLSYDTSLERQDQKTISQPSDGLAPQDCDGYRQIPTIPWYYQLSLFAAPLLALALIGALAFGHDQFKQKIRIRFRLIKNQRTIKVLNDEVGRLKSNAEKNEEDMEWLINLLLKQDKKIDELEHDFLTEVINGKEARAHLGQLTEELDKRQESLSGARILKELLDELKPYHEAHSKGTALNAYELKEESRVVGRLYNAVGNVWQSIKDKGLTPDELGETSITSFLYNAGVPLDPDRLGKSALALLLHIAGRDQLLGELNNDLDSKDEQDPS